MVRPALNRLGKDLHVCHGTQKGDSTGSAVPFNVPFFLLDSKAFDLQGELSTSGSSSISTGVKVIESAAGTSDVIYVNTGTASGKIKLTEGLFNVSGRSLAFSQRAASGVATDSLRYADGEFYQGRLWLLNNQKSSGGANIIASHSDDFFNFAPGTSLDNEALNVSVTTSELPRWLKFFRQVLMLGTDNSETSLSSDPKVLTPSNPPNAETESFYGSNEQPVVRLGDTIIYINSENTRMYSSEYDWRKAGFPSGDISYFSSHLIESGVIFPSYTKVEFPVVWAAKADFSGFVGCTYDKATSSIGWHNHVIGGFDDGDEVFGLAGARGDGRNILWAAINRNGETAPSNGRYSPNVEYFDPADGEVYLDSYVKITGSDVTAISAAHLADRTVGILADGMVHPDITLDGSGNGTLEFPADLIYVGLKYTSRMETMPLDFGDPKNSSRSFLKGWNAIYVGLLDSLVPLINGTRPKSRTPADNTGEQIPLTDEIVKVGDLGYTKEGTIVVEQDQPVPCEITGIFADGGQTNL